MQTTTYAKITYTHIGSSHRRHGCTIQRARREDGEIRYLVLRNGAVMAIARDGQGAMAFARPFNPHAR